MGGPGARQPQAPEPRAQPCPHQLSGVWSWSWMPTGEASLRPDNAPKEPRGPRCPRPWYTPDSGPLLAATVHPTRSPEGGAGVTRLRPMSVELCQDPPRALGLLELLSSLRGPGGQAHCYSHFADEQIGAQSRELPKLALQQLWEQNSEPGSGFKGCRGEAPGTLPGLPCLTPPHPSLLHTPLARG